MLATFLISLRRSSTRRTRAISMLREVGLQAEVWEATDGARLTPEEIDGVYDREQNRTAFKYPLSRAEIGCYLSHRRLWKEIARRGLPAALVLEDDAKADCRLPRLMAGLDPEQLRSVILKLDGLRAGGLCDIELGGSGFVYEPIIAPRTTGYIIGCQAAMRLSAPRRFFRPVDLDLKHHWEHGVPILSANPPLVHEASVESTIESSRQAGKGLPAQRFVSNILYQARFRRALASAPRPDLAQLFSKKDLQT